MGLAHGQTPPFDISTVDSQPIRLKYGPIVSGTGLLYTLPTSSTPDIPYGLRRYVVKYNGQAFEHVATYKTCRVINKPEVAFDTYDYPKSIRDVGLLNCMSAIHGPLVVESPPEGFLNVLNQVFNRPIIGQNMFVDCVSRQKYVAQGNYNYAINANKYHTIVSRYGVIKDDQVFYFKNAINMPGYAGRLIDVSFAGC